MTEKSARTCGPDQLPTRMPRRIFLALCWRATCSPRRPLSHLFCSLSHYFYYSFTVFKFQSTSTEKKCYPHCVSLESALPYRLPRLRLLKRFFCRHTGHLLNQLSLLCDTFRRLRYVMFMVWVSMNCVLLLWASLTLHIHFLVALSGCDRGYGTNYFCGKELWPGRS